MEVIGFIVLLLLVIGGDAGGAGRRDGGHSDDSYGDADSVDCDGTVTIMMMTVIYGLLNMVC